MTVSEAAVRLGLSTARVRQLCVAGRLGTKVGPIWIISRRELENFRRRKRQPGRPKR